MQEMQETRVQSMSQEDPPPEKEMATHCSILSWETPMDKGAWGATVRGVAKESGKTELLSTHTQGKKHQSFLSPTCEDTEDCPLKARKVVTGN